MKGTDGESAMTVIRELSSFYELGEMSSHKHISRE